MKKIAVVTDSNSGITQEEAQKMGIYVLPMPFTIDGNEYFEGINLTQEEFYEKLKGDADIATSQPSPHAILKLWDELLKECQQDAHSLLLIPGKHVRKRKLIHTTFKCICKSYSYLDRTICIITLSHIHKSW